MKPEDIKFIVGFTGTKGAGKSKAAAFLHWLEPRYEVASFSTPLKEFLTTQMGIEPYYLYGAGKDVVHPVYGVTCRHLMQTLGTEWGQHYAGKHVWVTALIRRAQSPYLVIDDVRFEHEADLVRKHGHLIHLGGRTERDDAHISEAGVTFRPDLGDLRIQNKGTLQDFSEDLAWYQDSVLEPKLDRVTLSGEES